MIKLNKECIIEKMIDGDRCDGCHVMAVSQDGQVSFHWMGQNRQWDSWEEDACITRIPPLYPAGSGREWEEMKDFLLHQDRWEEAESLHYDEDIPLDKIISRFGLSEVWGEWVETDIEWLAEAFLMACNGRGDELNDTAPWGVYLDEDGREEVIEPPFDFEWAEDE